ncbi:hypothetical protein J5N97_020137 [Dioscorea zingiberensis]|uniref:Uncharacterized protein n=1 Tax=Dioscorea zingiberensis TaxID=325984 RepID=A0A9D5CFB5_9LILI|nr:hypothetical protein J5N97_020137 [Dioscorea zingiberensis]
MADHAELTEWEEVLHASSPSPDSNPFVLDAAAAADDAGAIHPNYFSLSPAPRRPPSEPCSDDSSDRPSWLDPDSNPPCLETPKFDFSRKNPIDFWSDGSSTPPDSEKGESFRAFDQKFESGFEGIGESCQASDGIVVSESEGEELVEMRRGDGELEKVGIGIGIGVGDGDGEKKGPVWWKMPIELLKFYLLRVRPSWSVSILAAIVGAVMLGRRLYKMKQKSRTVPLKVSLDDKKASLFMARAARLNEAFSVMKRVPVIRQPSVPAGGVTPWSVLGSALSLS